MRRTSQDISPVSSSEIADDEDSSHNAVPVGDPLSYQQVLRDQRQSREPTFVSSTTTRASTDNNTLLQQIVTSSGEEEFVDILQVQQLLLENAGVNNAASVSATGRAAEVLGQLHRTATAVEYPHFGLEGDVRSRTLLESYCPTRPALPTTSHRHHHLPQSYYPNYVEQQQQQQQQQQTSSVEDLFALWLGSSTAGRSLRLLFLNEFECHQRHNTTLHPGIFYTAVLKE